MAEIWETIAVAIFFSAEAKFQGQREHSLTRLSRKPLLERLSLLGSRPGAPFQQEGWGICATRGSAHGGPASTTTAARTSLLPAALDAPSPAPCPRALFSSAGAPPTPHPENRSRDDAIKVLVRVRPAADARGSPVDVQPGVGQSLTLKSARGDATLHTFDHVLGGDVTQEGVFNLVEGALVRGGEGGEGG